MVWHVLWLFSQTNYTPLCSFSRPIFRPTYNPFLPRCPLKVLKWQGEGERKWLVNYVTTMIGYWSLAGTQPGLCDGSAQWRCSQHRNLCIPVMHMCSMWALTQKTATAWDSQKYVPWGAHPMGVCDHCVLPDQDKVPITEALYHEISCVKLQLIPCKQTHSMRKKSVSGNSDRAHLHG